MGSQAVQSKLWGQRVNDWAEIQEPTGKAGYDFVLGNLVINSTIRLLDVGCGSGYFCSMAVKQGADITGIDATAELIAEAKKRVPAATFFVGEMEELPFADNSFDVVCGFNSFQYATQTTNALAEARRVLKPGGKLVAMVWGNKEECEAATYLKAVGSLLPPPPPGAPGPFALSENQALETIMKETGLRIISNNDVTAIWDYANSQIALKGLMSAGPVARAMGNSSFDQVYDVINEAMQPYLLADGRVVYHNKYRVIIAAK